jgi:hypothetical protein
LGWTLLVLGVTPLCVRVVVGIDFTVTAGNAYNYIGLITWGGPVLILALRPTDAALIAFACCGWFLVACGVALVALWQALSLQGNDSNATLFRIFALALFALTLVCCAAFVPTIVSLEGGRCACARRCRRAVSC